MPVRGPLTYSVPDDMPVPEPGTRLRVPVARRHMVGVCMGPARAESIGKYRLRNVSGLVDEAPLLPDFLLDFLKWVSDYYFYPLGQVVSEALPPGFLSARASAISRLLSKGSARGRSRFRMPKWDSASMINLTSQQSEVLSHIEKSISKRNYSPVLLHGVTGSGKTEVYIRAAARCIESGRCVLVMVPEIAMTTQTTGWFAARFGRLLSVLHSGMTDAQRRDQWWRIRSGDSPIVVGTRSSVFAPLADVGLIVVDEEHDSSYKQTEKLCYNARDMALVLGKMHNATVLLGSATPSLASYTHALRGKYHLLQLPDRVTGRRLPEVTVIDRRKEDNRHGYSRGGKGVSPKGTWLTPRLETAIRETVSRGEQVILFLNRRGFATYVFCPECGHVFRCRNCDVTLTWHRQRDDNFRVAEAATGRGMSGFLMCHYCGHGAPAPPVCPTCGGQAVKAFGYGTEKVEQEVVEHFPGIRTARIDRDTVSSTRRLNEVIERFRAGDIDLIVGTQMITKGHDFPGLTLVGILWADMGLNVPEFNAAEKTFQLITQVAGRAGRGDRPGRVLVQTFMAGHFAIQAACAQDYETFYRKESGLRQGLGYAPFSRMINFKISGKSKSAVHKASESLALEARKICDELLNKPVQEAKQQPVDVLGPAPAPRARIKNRYRSQLLIKSVSIGAVRSVCGALIERGKDIIPSSVRVEVDVDPDSML